MGLDINAHDEYGKTPLHCAVGAQKLDIVLCLLRHRPYIDAHDDREDTPLHTAIRTGNIAIVTVKYYIINICQAIVRLMGVFLSYRRS